MQSRPALYLLAILAPLLPACVDDDDASELGAVAQAVSSSSQTPLYACSVGSIYGHNSCDFDLGVAADGHHVCIVDGVQGAISASGIQGGGTAMIEAPGRRYRLHLDTGYGSNRTIAASALCFAADPVATSFWSPGTPYKTIANAADSANMMCFLSGLRIAYNGFNNLHDNVVVKKDELGRWQVGGTQSLGTDLAAYATCVRPVGGGAWFYTYGWNGFGFFSLAPNSPPGGVVCGLNRLEGRFVFPNDKVAISYSALLQEWRMGFDGAAHGGDSYCMN